MPMERPSGNGLGPSRSRSVSPVSQSNVDVFDDEFAEDYAESVIAPSIRNENPFSDPAASANTSQVDLPLPPAAHAEPGTVQSPPPLQQPRESIRKSRGGPGNSVPSDGSDAIPRNVPVYPQRGSIAQRTNSTSSIAAPLSPTDGEHGPSHPYHMYPQALVASRTTSMTTSSIYRSPSQRSGTMTNRQGPTHPYALYPQDVFGDSSESSSTIPVGFPGHSQEFQRRLGSEGEDQDIVGPDGHTEQLPPYTRYPEAAVPRSTTHNRESLPMIGEASQSRDNLIDTAQMSGGAGSSETTLNNSSSHSQHAPSSQNESSSTESMSEKSFKDKTWKEKRKHRVCGVVPLWMILLSFIVVVVIVVICGGVIGGYLVKAVEKTRKKVHPQLASDSPPASPIGTPTGYVDVNPITTGTAQIAPLPTGSFDLVFGTPDAKYFSCLDSEVNAWSCDLPPKRYYTVHISHDDDRWYLESRPPWNTTKLYGAQPPDFEKQTLKFVVDLDAKGLGAAYHFQTFYDKVVIVPESFIQRSKEGVSSLDSILGRATTPKAIYSSTSAILAGDDFWVCEWEDTFLEGFIYVSELKASTTSRTREAAFQTSGTSTGSTGAFIPTTTTNSGTLIPYTPYTSNGYPASASPTSTANPYPYLLRRSGLGMSRRDGHGDGGEREDDGDDSAGGTDTTGPLTSSPPTTTSESVTTTTTTTTTRIPTKLPNLVKIEERRLAGTHGQPLCTLHTLLYDGKLVPKRNVGTGELVQVLLEEDDGRNWISMQRYRLKRRQAPPHRHRHSSASKEDLDSTCFCQWTSFDVSDGELVS